MLMKLLGVCCAIAATGTVLVYGLGLQVQRPIEPLQPKEDAPLTTPKAAVVASTAPVHAPAPELAQEQEMQEQETQELELLPKSELETGTPTTDYPRVAAATTESEVASSAAVAAEITVAVEPVDVEAAGSDAIAEQVFVFWQPFRSRGSAQGFAQGLSARAEVPISVISEATDAGRQYRVVLPYDTEAQRLERLAKLEAATRLEMGD